MQCETSFILVRHRMDVEAVLQQEENGHNLKSELGRPRRLYLVGYGYCRVLVTQHTVSVVPPCDDGRKHIGRLLANLIASIIFVTQCVV